VEKIHEKLDVEPSLLSLSFSLVFMIFLVSLQL